MTPISVMSVEYKTVLTTTAVLRLSEPEIRALDALAGYSWEGFLATFYEKMGKAYLEPHAGALKSLFQTINATCQPALAAVDKARRDLTEAERKRQKNREQALRDRDGSGEAGQTAKQAGPKATARAGTASPNPLPPKEPEHDPR